MTKRRALSPLAIVALLAGLLMIPTTAIADNHAAITSPAAGELVYMNTLNLEARNDTTAAQLLDSSDPDRTVPFVAWAVRSPVVDDCQGDNNNMVGDTNIDVFAGTKDFEDGIFTAEIDISEWTAGEYCFVFVPTDDLDSRQHLSFYVVDEYAKVGGNIDNADYLIDNHGDLDLKTLRGRQLSHAFSGVVGNAGSAGIVGEISVNYRQLNETCTFAAHSLSLDDDAPGIAGTGMDLRAVIGTNANCGIGSATFFALDRDANEPWDRGAVVVRPGGLTAHDPHLIDGTPGAGGGASWVPLESGNVHVGTR